MLYGLVCIIIPYGASFDTRRAKSKLNSIQESVERKVEGTRFSFLKDNPAPSPEDGIIMGDYRGASSGGTVDSSLRAESSGQLQASTSYDVRRLL